MEPIPVSDDVVAELDRIEFGIGALQDTLKQALEHDSKHRAHLRERSNKLWKSLAAAHGLDVHNKVYEVRDVDGQMSIVEVER